MNLANKQALRVALVTGGGRRIGASIVKALHGAGFDVAIHCHHSLPQAKALAEQLNLRRAHSACVIQQNLHEADAAKQLIDKTISWKGRLDAIINNASMFAASDFGEDQHELWEAMFRLNVQLPFLLSCAAYPFLTVSRGIIINITDIHAEKPLKGYSVYCQTKAALLMQTKSLAREFAPEIRVNAVAPGAIIWPEHENALSPDKQQQIIASTPLKRHGNPDFVAQAVIALLENPYITGQVLNVDGGRSIV
ncbi:pteridine reductase [Legionella jordanis]|uniref:Pteridine reductase n=1 Tax=Legionella jordanis TaxID=456 RepID=A0A0W0VCH5_9GAMM|nr:pteridine reductase [Legionella jordanis]KTD17791.1 pteridine reductase [Legionella jordanis]RMX02506.1 pteridine reductase [Legionella jordanis]RMX21651.1 pteridine reductase [Legionella jordanis]VEH11272.1 pteridine reductase [Legionella jordanis]HAT8713760.1 pteridine reductase [Legionella jordanis]